MPSVSLAAILLLESVLRLVENSCALVAVWLAFYSMYLLVVAVHEMGHLLTGMACGFRIKEFRVSCVRWRGGWGLDWRGANLLSGWVNVQLTRPDDRLRLRRFLFVAAGPFANLAFSILLYPVAIQHSTWGGMAKYLFVGSTLLAVVNLIPMKARTFKSDGLQMFRTVFDRKGFEAIRFDVRCQEAAPVLQAMREKGDWAGVKQLTERLLAVSASVRAKEEVVKTLNTVLLFADRQLAEAAIAGK